VTGYCDDCGNTLCVCDEPGVRAGVTVPDPCNPKVRDAFLTDLGSRVTMTTVGPTMTTVHHPVDGEYFVRRSVVATWTPAPPPLITEDVVIWLKGTYDSVILHPGGTYTEVPA
jgi:hypothetical protein